jgi:hypothetical protein
MARKPRVGRPPSPEPLSAALYLRVTDRKKALVETLAADERRSVATMLALLVDEALAMRGMIKRPRAAPARMAAE